MEAHVDAGMLFKKLDERQIGIFVSLLKHMAEITARLMGMNHEDEMEALWHRDNISH